MNGRRFYSLVAGILLSLQGIGQTTILGTITDSEGQRLPFATVYVEGTTNGTTSNEEGNYQLKVLPGTHRITAQYVGYQKSTKVINTQITASLDFVLEPETLLLQEVVVSASNKNPAHRIIREAIKKRKYHENEVQAYSCDVYIKGVQRLDKKPRNLLGLTITVDTGIVYLSESLSKYQFERPDKIYEEMIASKFSGQPNGFSYNRASEMSINMYQNSFFVEGLSERSFISPIAKNAFISYDYRLEGVMVEDSTIINKIRVIPRRPTDPVFSGHIYIIENDWRLHSVDVMLTKANGIDFVDSLRIKQVFTKADHGIWMPLSQRFSYQFKALGFKGSGHFTGIYSNYQIEPNYDLFKKEVTYQKTFGANHQDKDLFQKKDFTSKVMKVEKGSNEKDSIFWKSVRPVPLTRIEVKDYKIKDSIQVVRDSKPYKDSVDRVRNRFKIGNLAFLGYTHFDSYNETYIGFPNLFQTLEYNTTEGFAPSLSLKITKQKKQIPAWEIRPTVRYGFGNQKIQAKADGYLTLDYKNWNFLYGGVGRYVFQYNAQNPIDRFVNSYFTLIEGQNFLKQYQSTFLYSGYQREVYNNFRINLKVEYAQRSSMNNVADYSFRNNPEFTPNTYLTAPPTFFSLHQNLTTDLLVTWRPGRKYIDRPERKIYLNSKMPIFNLRYRKAIPAFGADMDFDFLSFGTDYKLRMGVIGESEFQLETGTFINAHRYTFADLKHFNGNQVYVKSINPHLNFQLLPYYEYSTRSGYLELHYEHHFNEFILNKLPLIKRLNLQSVAMVNYLTTEQIGHYLEVGVGIEHIFRFLRIDFVSSFRNGSHSDTGLRIGGGF